MNIPIHHYPSPRGKRNPALLISIYAASGFIALAVIAAAYYTLH